MKKIGMLLLSSALSMSFLQAADFNAQAEKDRKAMIKYFEDKFEDAEKNKAEYFPYSTDEEVQKAIAKGVKHEDFANGNYSFNIDGKAQWEQMREDFPPYEDNVEKGEELWFKEDRKGNSIAKCFDNKPESYAKYPYYDNDRKQVVTITQAINECITEKMGKRRAWKTSKGKMADVQAYMAFKTKEAGLKVNVKINSKEAAEAYERGKEYFYTQRGYLKLNCAECHVQGSGKRVRNEKLSPTLGSVTHFPVYRLKWSGLGTLERRMGGCIKDQGQVPPKATSDEMKELLFFMSYMSNELNFNGPDIRK